MIAISSFSQQEVRRLVQCSVFINKSPCYAAARVDLKTLNVAELHLASVYDFDRNEKYTSYLTASDVYEAEHGYKHVAVGDGIKCTINGMPLVFLPPVVEMFGPYNVVVGGFNALFDLLDAGQQKIPAMVVRNITRELPPFEYIPQAMPKSSLDVLGMTWTKRENGEHRHFVSAY